MARVWGAHRWGSGAGWRGSRTGGKGLAGRLDGSWGPWGVKVVLCVSKGWNSLGSKVWVKMKSEPERSVGAGGQQVVRDGEASPWTG